LTGKNLPVFQQPSISCIEELAFIFEIEEDLTPVLSQMERE
jgi:hypothetical protein